MAKKRFQPEEIITKLREADILISQGKPIAETRSGAENLDKPLSGISATTKAH